MNISKDKNISDNWAEHTDKLTYPDILTIILYINFKKGKIVLWLACLFKRRATSTPSPNH